MTAERRLVGADGRDVCRRCAVAETPLRRMRGLLGRRELAADEGVLLRPAPSIHTFFMRFAIDVVFLDRELRVVHVAANVKPWRATGRRHARAALELRAGEAARRRILVGERLRFAEWGREAVIKGARKIRVVIAAADRPFLNIASFLLARDGFEVEPARDPTSVCDVVERHRANVVVFDATDASVSRQLLALARRHPDVGVVVVSESPTVAEPSTPLLPKWGAFAGLREAIESASA